jgi:subtilase family serine protease
VTSLSRTSAPGASECTVQFTIKNIGSATADSSTANVHGHAGIAGNWNGYSDTPALPPGASVELTGTIDHPCEGTSIIVTADSSADVDESNEDNNQLGTAY